VSRLIADCGSIWTKLRDLETGETRILPTREMLRDESLRFEVATGHLGRRRAERFENELVALAQGALKLVPDDDFIVVDVGARDTKYCRFRGRRLDRLDWNQSCGANTGFTLELLARYYDVDFGCLPVAEHPIAVTCGVLGMEKIFDAVIHGDTPETAIAQFVGGLALNVFSFAGRPECMHLSGGLCLNGCFVASLERYCAVAPLGRMVLLEGLD
jgi:activator of 2-hydroxyglutaryl-CoA dehydratase